MWAKAGLLSATSGSGVGVSMTISRLLCFMRPSTSSIWSVRLDNIDITCGVPGRLGNLVVTLTHKCVNTMSLSLAKISPYSPRQEHSAHSKHFSPLLKSYIDITSHSQFLLPPRMYCLRVNCVFIKCLRVSIMSVCETPEWLRWSANISK